MDSVNNSKNSQKVTENRRMRRYILNKMEAKKRKAFIAKEQFYEEMNKIHKEMGEHWKTVVKSVTPEWQRDIALSIPANWYKLIIDRISMAILALGWKWGAWLFSVIFLTSVQNLSKIIYGFGTRTVANTLEREIEMIIYHKGKVLSHKKWEIKCIAELKTAISKVNEDGKSKVRDI